ncbi:MAG: DUF58 domain-containing protein [Flavobacteriales bacterium]|nr:DUF58 domain-containing protein [Flavobacteriales bacterium]MBL6869171.1 DUF58 domain-containing protein [Flavobacteriales bacterium]
MINYKTARKFGSLELLAKQVVEGFITGLHQSPFHGFSVEFAEHRLYNSGESVKHLDWKLLARTDKLFIKRYEEETNLRCHILIDSSSSMMFPVDQPYNKFTFSVDAAAALIFLMRKQRDAFGLSIFSDSLDFYSPAKSSLTHQRFLLSNLERILKNEKKSFKNKKTNIAKMLNALASKIHKRSLVFIFSDFMAIDNPEDFANSIKHLRHHLHEIVVFDVSHHNLENQLNLKNKYYNVVDVETGDSIKMHPKQIKEKYITERNSMKSKIHNLLKQQKVDLISADIEIGFDQILLEYLLKRKKIY